MGKFGRSPIRQGFLVLCLTCLLSHGALGAETTPTLRVGWSEADITPEEPVVITGQFAARVSEGVMDPITATVLALESRTHGTQVILVSCDLIGISDSLRDAVRARVAEMLPELAPEAIVLNATHTHAAPELRTEPEMARELGIDVPDAWSRWGIALDAMTPVAYVAFAAEHIAAAVVEAWETRAPGGLSYGLGHAVVGHNRLVAYADGRSQMYGATKTPDFSHMEGFEDHAVNLLYFWTEAGALSGVVINVACPSQHDESIYEISADFWHEVRQSLRAALGAEVRVFAQCAAAGDQSERIILRRDAETRMKRIMGINRREQIARRITHTVTELLPYLEEHVDWQPVLAHRVTQMELTRRAIGEEEAAHAEAEQARWRGEYERLRTELEAQPELGDAPRWYAPVTRAYSGMLRETRVIERAALQHDEPKAAFEIHVLRLGDIAMATNPFELYLDYGLRMQARSKAIQTFVVQLAGPGTYLPTERAVAGGAYGAVPASNIVGPEGGQELVEQTLAIIESMWAED